MQTGDYVRLKQAFRPTLNHFKTYDFGIVVGVIPSRANIEVLINLYDPETATPYIDEDNISAIYSFQAHELESHRRQSSLPAKEKKLASQAHTHKWL